MYCKQPICSSSLAPCQSAMGPLYTVGIPFAKDSCIAEASSLSNFSLHQQFKDTAVQTVRKLTRWPLSGWQSS